MLTKKISGLLTIIMLTATALLSGCASDKMDTMGKSMDSSMDKPMMKDADMNKSDDMMKQSM